MKRFFTPTWVVSLFIFLLPWQTRYIFGLSVLSGSFTQFGILSVYATQVCLVLGLAGAYLVQGPPVIEGKYRGQILLGGLILAVVGVSSLLAQQSIPALAAVIDLAMAGITFVALLDKRVNLRWVMSAFVAGLLIPVGLGFVQVAFGETGASSLLGLAARDANQLGDAVFMLSDGSRVLRAYGTFPHPNNFAGYLAVGLLTTLALPFTGARKARVIIAMILALGLALTASRSALLGLMLGGGLAMLVMHVRPVGLARKVVMPIAILVVGLALGVTLLAPSWAAALRGGGTLEDRSLSERADQYHEWPATMQAADWLIGSGPRSYVFTLATIHPDRGVWEYQPIHNVPLLVLAEVGLLGLIAMIAWIVTLDRQNFARFPDRQAAYAHGMGKVLFVIIFFDHYLWSSWAGLILVAYVGALMLRLGEKEVDIDVDKARVVD
jgi:hypothetical protein